ncbi:unnamed protein product [Bursaphelenchus okinawaensis]|uniref:Uncharacterized protein n=1 Tax=Bursaphelenchus okinawaensis TaxID=465554 RepID=A0A811JR08_9BILA|nr:unnamed protein product [Bursaphelenchus okinawaensis]CAG9079477.1 unnamed protein product [Bursaphelenchus okinawaensis]
MSISSLPLSISLNPTSEQTSFSEDDSDIESSGSLEHLPDLPYEYKQLDDEEEVERRQKMVDEFWEKEEVGGKRRGVKTLHLNGRLRPKLHYKFWFDRVHRKKDGKVTTTTESTKDSKSTESDSLENWEDESDTPLTTSSNGRQNDKEYSTSADTQTSAESTQSQEYQESTSLDSIPLITPSSDASLIETGTLSDISSTAYNNSSNFEDYVEYDTSSDTQIDSSSNAEDYVEYDTSSDTQIDSSSNAEDYVEYDTSSDTQIDSSSNVEDYVEYDTPSNTQVGSESLLNDGGLSSSDSASEVVELSSHGVSTVVYYTSLKSQNYDEDDALFDTQNEASTASDGEGDEASTASDIVQTEASTTNLNGATDTQIYYSFTASSITQNDDLSTALSITQSDVSDPQNAIYEDLKTDEESGFSQPSLYESNSSTESLRDVYNGFRIQNTTKEIVNTEDQKLSFILNNTKLEEYQEETKIKKIEESEC